MRSQKGVMLLTALLLLLVVSLIGATLTELFSAANLSARIHSEEIKAFYLAEAGIAQGIHTLKGRLSEAGGNVTPMTEETLGPVRLGEGTFTVKLNSTQSLITSIGDVRGTQKKLQMQYKAL